MNKTTRNALVIFTVAVSALTATTASAETWKIKSGLSRATFVSDASFETINGNTSAVSGSINLTIDNPNAATAKVSLPVKSLKTGVDLRDKHLASSQWLDAAKHPDILFELASVRLESAKLVNRKKVKGKVTGKLTVRGKTLPVKASVLVTYHELPPAKRRPQMGLSNDLLRIRVDLEIKLSDYGIEIPGPLKDVKVSDTLQLRLDLTAVKNKS